jgi:hypothetical protein
LIHGARIRSRRARSARDPLRSCTPSQATIGLTAALGMR